MAIRETSETSSHQAKKSIIPGNPEAKQLTRTERGGEHAPDQQKLCAPRQAEIAGLRRREQVVEAAVAAAATSPADPAAERWGPARIRGVGAANLVGFGRRNAELGSWGRDGTVGGRRGRRLVVCCCRLLGLWVLILFLTPFPLLF